MLCRVTQHIHSIHEERCATCVWMTASTGFSRKRLPRAGSPGSDLPLDPSWETFLEAHRVVLIVGKIYAWYPIRATPSVHCISSVGELSFFPASPAFDQLNMTLVETRIVCYSSGYFRGGSQPTLVSGLLVTETWVQHMYYKPHLAGIRSSSSSP